MKNIKDLKIVHKISALVILMVFFITLIGGMGYYYNTKTSHNLLTIYYDRLLSVLWINEIRVHNRTVQSILYDIITTKNPRIRVSMTDKLQGHLIKTNELLSSYKKTKLTEYEKNRIKLLENFINREKLLPNVIIEKLKTDDLNEIIDFYHRNEIRFENFENILKDLAEHNRDIAYEIMQENNNNTKQANRTLMELLLLSIFLSITLGIYIIKTITAPLYELFTYIREVSNGNLLIKDLDVKSKNEIGELAEALNTMKYKIKDSLKREQLLREMITKVRNYNTHDQIYDFFLNFTTTYYNATGAIHFHYTSLNELIIKNSYSTVEDSICLINEKSPFCKALKEELIELAQTDLIYVNNLEAEFNKKTSLYKYFADLNIKSFIIYPIKTSTNNDNLIDLSFTMIYFNKPNKWSVEDKDFFRTLCDSIKAIYSERIQKEEIEETKRNFISTITHDLRSPLYAEQKALEMIMASKPDTKIENYFEYIKDIYNTNEELLKIVNNLLSVTHYESKTKKLNLEYNDINECIATAVRSLKPLASDKKQNIIIDKNISIEKFLFDENEITRVLMNLISNAIKYTPNNSTIEVSSSIQNNYLQVSVKDNGHGISEEEKEYIFSKYPGKKRKVGTGLGLYLCKQIIDAHKGKIWFKSKENEGTTFFFSIPIH